MSRKYKSTQIPDIVQKVKMIFRVNVNQGELVLKVLIAVGHLSSLKTFVYSINSLHTAQLRPSGDSCPI